MTNSNKQRKLWQRKIALPSDHGSWVFLLAPLLAGFFIGGRWSAASLLLTVAALAVFLLRQPAAMIVKAYSGRRSRKDLPAALFWFGLYAMAGAAAVAGLVWQGYSYILWLGVPGIFVFSWHLWLVSRREERRRMGVDILASGALALAAPAAYWVSIGEPALTGWWLWGLLWFQTAASIVYAFLRLEQRVLKESPSKKARWRMGRRALAYASFNLLASILIASLGWQPKLLWLPYLVQWLEVVWGITHPAVGAKPTQIGWRQLVVSTLFTILFIFAYSV
ncbi:MAG TPA: YwiC-like family protein [Anaerolineales bacterium]|nr:YwiC-like family protein [Anaerolineales bacterium]